MTKLPEFWPGPEPGTPWGGEAWGWGWEEDVVEEWGWEEEVITEISFSFSVENPESATVLPVIINKKRY